MKSPDCAVPDNRKAVTAAELHNKKVPRVVRPAAPWLFVVASPSPELKGILTAADNLDTWKAILDGINGGSGQAPVPVAPDHRIIAYRSLTSNEQWSTIQTTKARLTLSLIHI